MGLVPSSRLGKIEFFEAHLPAWQAHSLEIGLVPGELTAFAAEVASARDAYDQSQVQREVSKASTQAFYNKTASMAATGAGFIAAIRAHAETKDDPNVYVLAQIPQPSPPSAAPPPGTPTDFRVELLQNGAVRLGWKCSNPAGASGTIYEVYRKIGSGSLGFVGSIGVKSFTDGTLPLGAAGVMYQITAARSTVRGNPATFNVNFGVGGDGAAFATVTPVKLAA
jgi:hypothetical protein